MANILFKEKQKFENKLILLGLSLFTLILLFGAIKSFFAGEINLGNGLFFIGVALLSGIFLWWLRSLRLKVSITDKKIKYKISPIHSKKHAIRWQEVEKCEIVKTPPHAQWAGHNIAFNHEKNISLNGRNGLAITTKDGKSYFIGFRNIDKLEEVLKRYSFLFPKGRR